MKHKTEELEGALLDAAVAKAEGAAFRVNDGKCWTLLRVSTFKTLAAAGGTINVPAGFHETLNVFCPSSDWSHGGPIIERFLIDICWQGAIEGSPWAAWVTRDAVLEPAEGRGPTPLIAAMRAYAASKFGEEVEL